MIQWDPIQQARAEEVAERQGLPVATVKEIVEVYMRHTIRRARKYEPVVIVNMGLFYIDPRKTGRKLRSVMRRYREGELTLEEVRHTFSVWWPVHEAARKHLPLTGKRYKVNMRINGSNWGVLKAQDNE